MFWKFLFWVLQLSWLPLPAAPKRACSLVEPKLHIKTGGRGHYPALGTGAWTLVSW